MWEKVDETIESMCFDCYKEQFPPIKELKPINIKYCNSCKNINYNNQNITSEEFEKRLPNIIKKNIILNKNYIFKDLKITDFSIVSNKIRFKFEVDCDIKK